MPVCLVWLADLRATAAFLQAANSHSPLTTRRAFSVNWSRFCSQGRRLTLAKSLPSVAMLVEELQKFQVRVTESAQETFGAFGQGYHDDLVLAIMIAACAAEHAPMGCWGVREQGQLRLQRRFWFSSLVRWH